MLLASYLIRIFAVVSLVAMELFQLKPVIAVFHLTKSPISYMWKIVDLIKIKILVWLAHPDRLHT